MKHLFIYSMLALSIAACGGHTDNNSNAETATTQDQDTIVAGLHMPEIPAMITSNEARAAYFLQHFWDDLDFRDTARVNDPNVFEQAFANYQMLFQTVDSTALAQAVERLLSRAEVESASYDRVMSVAEKYLFDPNSPMRNDDYYAFFLRAAVASDHLSAAEKIRPRDQLRQIAINRPGTLATDFRYVDRNGRQNTLLKTEAERLLVVFYDPDCEQCKEILGEMFGNAALERDIAENKLTVLAICITEDRQEWRDDLSRFPASWLVGFDLSRIEDNELYAFPATPSFYLLDSKKTVLMKDPQPSEVMRLIASL